MNAPAAPILFLSGAGLPAWIWDDVISGLPTGSDGVVARYPRPPGSSLAAYADAVAAQAPGPAFTVVAHSSGGVVAAELLARHPGRVTAVLGVSAVVPRPGRSFVGSMPLPARLVLPLVLRKAGTRPPAKAIRGGLAGGLPGAVADRLVAEFDPESVHLYLDPTSDRALPPACGFLLTTRDKELTPAVQRRSAEALGAAWLDELATGHLPMLESPDAVVRGVRRLLAPQAGA